MSLFPYLFTCIIYCRHRHHFSPGDVASPHLLNSLPFRMCWQEGLILLAVYEKPWADEHTLSIYCHQEHCSLTGLYTTLPFHRVFFTPEPLPPCRSSHPTLMKKCKIFCTFNIKFQRHGYLSLIMGFISLVKNTSYLLHDFLCSILITS